MKHQLAPTTSYHGRWLREQRLAMGIPQIELARRLGISDKAVSYYELGRRGVPRWVKRAVEKMRGAA